MNMCRSELPLAAWPEEVLLHEPAHGLFQRMTECNFQISVSAFANQLGLNGRNRDMDELLRFCKLFPIQNIEALATNTPIVDGARVSILGEVVRREDWSINRTRVCPECLVESPYHRTWFDLVLIQNCPLHQVRLEECAGGERIAWWCPQVGITPSGHRPPPRPPVANAMPFDTYVLGRLGVIERTANPQFDHASLTHVVEACELVGCWVTCPLPDPSI